MLEWYRYQLQILTEVLNLRVHLWVANQGQERGFDWGNRRRESKIGALSIISALAEAMLKDAIDDATDTEGRLDYVRSVLLFLCRAGLFCEAYHLPSQGVLLLVGCDRDCLRIGDLLSESFLGFLVGCLEKLNHCLLVFLKGFSNDLLVKLLFCLRDSDFFGEASRGLQLNTGLFHVLGQIES